ncbi:MAG: nitroreductase family protein [Sedimentisphaerales bacterium]|nr:nitroreductase family protein [Sedimentisphaerales bacterium]
MSFLDLVNKRYSIRNYKETPVPREKIDRCIEAARLAPSACNSQPWKFVIVDDAELIKDAATAAFTGILDFNHFVFKAPVLVLIVSERQKISAKFGSIVKKKNFSLMDIGIAAEHFCLQAAEEDLGTCMLGWFNEKKVKKVLSIPALKRVELMISIGFSADEKVPDRNRKTINQMSSYNKYS